jgi:phosphoribosyl-ATP pyrophosphohydrolase
MAYVRGDSALDCPACRAFACECHKAGNSTNFAELFAIACVAGRIGLLGDGLCGKATACKTKEEDVRGAMMKTSISVPVNAAAATPPSGDAIARLWSALDAHVKLHTPVPARTARLVTAGEPKMAQKLVEEAGELAVAAMVKDRVEIVRESADLIYHLTILWASLGIRPEEVWEEMATRESAYGLAEKRAKVRRRD